MPSPTPTILTAAILRILGAVAGPVSDKKLCRLLGVDMLDPEHVRTLSVTLVGIELSGVIRRTQAGYEMVDSGIVEDSSTAGGGA